MCDGQAADGCQIITLAEVETILNDRLTRLDGQFAIINDILKAKKEAFIKMCRQNPMTSNDAAVLRLQETLESFDPMNIGEIPELEVVETVKTAPVTEGNQTIICQSFSGDNLNVTVSPCKRSFKYNGADVRYGDGCCFINHQKIQKNQILKWSLRVPKFRDSVIGTVIILK